LALRLTLLSISTPNLRMNGEAPTALLRELLFSAVASQMA
jgi:hypothetical protein